MISNPSPTFERVPGETPRAFSAFTAYFQLGRQRSLQAAADQCEASIDTVKKWSSKFDWQGRIQSFNSATFQGEAVAEALALQRQEIAEWSARMTLQRELQWIAGQELIEAAQGWLANFGDDQLEKLTLSQVTRAIVVGSKIRRMALAGFENPLDAKVQSTLLAGRSELLSPETSPVPTKVSQSLQVEEPRSVSTTPIDLCIDAGTCEKNISVTKGAEKCHLHSSTETHLPAQLQPTPGLDTQPDQRATSEEMCVPTTINRLSQPNKKILIPESAEKCRSQPSGEADLSADLLPTPHSDKQPAMRPEFYFSPLAPRHSPPNPFQTPVPVTDPRSTIKVPSCPSRRFRHPQKKVLVVKSARKCRSLPMMIKTRHVTLPCHQRSVWVNVRSRTTPCIQTEMKGCTIYAPFNQQSARARQKLHHFCLVPWPSANRSSNSACSAV